MINGTPVYSEGMLEEMGVDQNALEKMGIKTLDLHDNVLQMLANHMEPFSKHFFRSEQVEHFTTYIKGFLSDLKRKSAEPIAITYGGRSKSESGVSRVRAVSRLLTGGKWDTDGMRKDYTSQVSEVLSEEGGMITCDGTSFPKKGKNSACVAPQYCGASGKIDNCQDSIMIGYAGNKGYGIIDYQLFAPEKWFEPEYKELRKKCGLPSDLKYKSKLKMANEMIEKAYKSGQFKANYIGADSWFGSSSSFIDNLPSGLKYFVDIKSNMKVFRSRPRMILPPPKGQGRKPTVEKPEFAAVSVKSIAEDPNLIWGETCLGIGSKGPMLAKDAFLRVVDVRDDKPGNDVWLYIRKLEDGTTKYALCNAPETAAPNELRIPATQRWAIEQCFEECKDHLGMDHYEVRSWDGWHRHIILCLIAHLFVIKLRIKYSIKVEKYEPTPYVEAPVDIDEFLDACEKKNTGQPINNKNMREAPKRSQQVLTIGLVLKIIREQIKKALDLMKELEYYLRKAASAHISHAKAKVRECIKDKPEWQIRLEKYYA